jgi:5-(carboxyamino)imidazole ribonucleotide synthase
VLDNPIPGRQGKPLIMERPLMPGGTLGILGGGQLGRMSAIAARRLGYKVRTFDPAPGLAPPPSRMSM